MKTTIFFSSILILTLCSCSMSQWKKVEQMIDGEMQLVDQVILEPQATKEPTPPVVTTISK